MEFVYPILIFVVMGIVFGVLLVVISKVFAVKTDERAVQITEALPGANCGACGYAGCADYADAIVNKGAPMNACLPGGANAAAAIGDIMGVSVTASERMVPVLHCNGTCEATNRKFTFDGVQSCTAAKRFYGGCPSTGGGPGAGPSGAGPNTPCPWRSWGTAFPSVKTMSSRSKTALPHSVRKSVLPATSVRKSVPTG